MSIRKNIKDEAQGFGYALRILLWVFLVAAILGGASNLLGLWSTSFFAPRVEAIRYRTFQESQTYNEGMLHDLQDIQMQYLAATPDQKQALRGIALYRFGAYPFDRLTPDMQAFYTTLKQGAQQ
jgi:hypothetical protein